MSAAYRVFVVLDRNYGARLTDLVEIGPVWIVDTPVNRAVAEKIWAADRCHSHLDGVTTFKFVPDSSEEDVVINKLETTDLHHGIYSSDPPYTILEIIGTPVTPRLKAELALFGFDTFEQTALGFRAVRPLPKNE
jgi:hypothetical protein